MSEQLFIPTLGWVTMLVDHRMPNSERETINPSRLTVEDYESLQQRYAEMIDVWLASRIDDLRHSKKQSESLSIFADLHPDYDPDHNSGHLFTFQSSIGEELLDRLRITTDSPQLVLQPLHVEFGFHSCQKSYQRPWGQMSFNWKNGLTLQG